MPKNFVCQTDNFYLCIDKIYIHPSNPLQTMTLQQFEYIIAVDRFRHFSKAAEYCRVTQPTLSAMIQKLEEELNTRIFDRSQQPICPTPVGIQLIKQAREILVQAGRMKEIVSEEKQSCEGTFRLGILPTIAPYLLPRFFHNLTKKYPKLDIRVAEMKTPHIKQSLLTGEIDAGILANLDGMDADYTITHLFYEQFLAYVSRKSKLFDNKVIRTAELANEQLWMLNEGHCFRDQMVKFCQLKSAQMSQLTYNLCSMETFMRMVESGNGITFVPGLAVEQFSESQLELVRSFAIPTPMRQIVILTNRNYIRQTILDAISSEIRACVPKTMHSLTSSQVAI